MDGGEVAVVVADVSWDLEISPSDPTSAPATAEAGVDRGIVPSGSANEVALAGTPDEPVAGTDSAVGFDSPDDFDSATDVRDDDPRASEATASA